MSFSCSTARTIKPYWTQNQENYSDYTVRLSDPGLDRHNFSSCPMYSFVVYDLAYIDIYISYVDNVEITFLNCLRPVNNTLYVENAFCSNKSTFSNSSQFHSYITLGRITVLNLEEHCALDTVAWASVHGTIKDNTTYASIHDLLAYGFEVKWYPAVYVECKSKRCTLDENQIRCPGHSCYEGNPLAEGRFLCI